MVDSLAMFFGAKRRSVKPPANIVVNGRKRKLYMGPNGGIYYKTKSGNTYVSNKFVHKHDPNRRASPKRRRASPERRTRWGYGLGQPSLLNMMGPAGLTVMPQHPSPSPAHPLFPSPTPPP